MSLICLSGPTIPAGSALSEGIDVSAGRIFQLVMPDAWSGGAQLSVQAASHPGLVIVAQAVSPRAAILVIYSHLIN